MKSVFTSLWQRRWCRLLAIVLIVFALAMLHPFTRQTLIGPRIDYVPWCVWEEYIRRDADPGRPPSWFYQMLDEFGLIRGRLYLSSPELLPMLIHLADDEDPGVRQIALDYVRRRNWPNFDEEVLPILKRRVHDDDPGCRAIAAAGVWWRTRDAEMLHVLAPLVDHPEKIVRILAIEGLGFMSEQVPEAFEPLAKACEGPDAYARGAAMLQMHHFGKRALPLMRDGLGDQEWLVRRSAAIAVGRIAKDASELEGTLRELLRDPESSVQEAADAALSKIDPLRYPPRDKKEH